MPKSAAPRPSTRHTDRSKTNPGVRAANDQVALDRAAEIRRREEAKKKAGRGRAR